MGDKLVERDVDLHSFGYKVLNLLELLELVLALDVAARVVSVCKANRSTDVDSLSVSDNHPSHEATQRRDAVPLANADNRCIDMGCAGF